MASLTQPRNIVSSLISSLRPPDNSSATPTTSSNPLSNATDETRNAILTLHVLFPNELLPALDLLDRNLITRLIIQSDNEPAQRRPPPDPQPGELHGRLQRPQPTIQGDEDSQQPQARPSRPQTASHQRTQQPKHVPLPNVRRVPGPVHSPPQPPPSLQPRNSEREVGGLLRPIQAPGQLAVGGDSVWQSSGLEPSHRLREVWRQQEGQGKVRAQDQHRGGGERQGDGRSQGDDYVEAQLREQQHQSSNQPQSQLRQHECQQHQAAAQEQNPGPRPQRQTSRECEILQRPQHRLSTSQPLLRPETTHQEREASTSKIRDEASLPRLPHTEARPLRRRAPSQTQGSAPSKQIQEQHPQIPDQTLLDPEPTLLGRPRKGGDQSLDDESEGSAGERYRRVRSQAREGVYVVRSAQVFQGGARVGRQRGTGAAAQAWLPGAAHYEVRVRAWSCSCPAFVFAAFPAAKSESNETKEMMADDAKVKGWSFGGLTLGNDMPVCKHLLACVLVDFGGMFTEFVEERVVSVEELAGWAAGWGD